MPSRKTVAPASVVGVHDADQSPILAAPGSITSIAAAFMQPSPCHHATKFRTRSARSVLNRLSLRATAAQLPRQSCRCQQR